LMFRILRKCSTRKLQMCPSPSSAVSPETTATKNDALVGQSIDSPLVLSCAWKCSECFWQLCDRVYVPVWCPCVYPSVCPVYRSLQQHAAGLLLWVPRPGDSLSIDCCTAGGSRNCEQRYVVSCRKKLNANLLTAADCCRLHQPSWLMLWITAVVSCRSCRFNTSQLRLRIVVHNDFIFTRRRHSLANWSVSREPVKTRSAFTGNWTVSVASPVYILQFVCVLCVFSLSVCVCVFLVGLSRVMSWFYLLFLAYGQLYVLCSLTSSPAQCELPLLVTADC